MNKIFTAAIIALLISPLASEENSFKKSLFLPRDDSKTDREFSIFIEKFRKDIRMKNFQSLKKSISPDIRWTFGEEYGIKSFMKTWGLDKNPKGSEFWDEMDEVLSMGSAWQTEDKSSMAFPYLFVTFPAEYDSYEFAAVTGKNVNMRERPSSKSKIVETLSYEIVRTVVTNEGRKIEKIGKVKGRWVKVTTSSGKTGYIFSRYVHSPIGYRAIFEKRDGKWLLVAFISGD